MFNTIYFFTHRELTGLMSYVDLGIARGLLDSEMIFWK